MEISGNSYVATNLSLVALFIVPLTFGAIFFIRSLIKSYMLRCTTIRKDLDFGKHYLNGRFGAVPFNDEG